MEKGRITVEMSKKGKMIVTLTREDQKRMTVPATGRFFMEDNRAEVEYTLSNGQITQLIIQGEDRMKAGSPAPAHTSKTQAHAQPQPQPQSQSQSDSEPQQVSKQEILNVSYPLGPAPNGMNGKQNQHVSQFPGEQAKGHTYYNFVPLNEQILCFDDPKSVVDHSSFSNDQLSGVLHCSLTNLQPLFISAGKKSNDSNAVLPFFAPNGEICIPGSTIRGMLREMVNIVTFGKFNQFDTERRLFTRPMADMDNQFRGWYDLTMTTPPDKKKGEKVKSFKAQAGYLRFDKSTNSYYIQPAFKDSNERQYYQKKIDQLRRDEGLGNLAPFAVHQSRSGGYVVISGPAPKKKREWFINAPDNQKKPVILSDNDIANYLKDCDLANPSRKIKINQIERYVRNMGQFPDGLPIFFIQRKVQESGKTVVHTTIGHTGLFRMSYEKTLGDHVAPSHLDERLIDVTERIFGRIPDKIRAAKVTDNQKDQVFAHAGFVNVSDAYSALKVEAGKPMRIVQAGPKPTAFQHYLVQGHTNQNGKSTWNQDTWLRGHKMYWHQEAHSNVTPDTSSNMITHITPVEAGHTFSFKIHFNNLHPFELGALLTILNLPKGKALKLGMGKGLGFGSVTISSTLELIERQKRYLSLFEENSWKLAKKNAEVKDFIETFQAQLLQLLKTKESFWNIPRMKQLNLLLDIQRGQGLQSQRKLIPLAHDDRENRKRKILPLPENV
jgi:CRISPR-associated protein (TIGR03986 family)